MNKTQWFVLSGIFILINLFLIFSGIAENGECISDTFGNFQTSLQPPSLFYEDYSYNEYNLIRCAVANEMYNVYINLAWFFAMACFVMGFLELKPNLIKKIWK